MKELLDRMLNTIDARRLMEHTQAITRLELGQTSEHHLRTAEFTAGLVREAGIHRCDIIDFPADGTTVYQDKRMPLAWTATIGRLTLTRSPMPFADPVIADYQRHPFHLVKGSVATPAGGCVVRIIAQSQLSAGADAAGCLVLTDADTAPRSGILRAALDCGALGLVSDHLVGRAETPDGIQWVNNCTDSPGAWHVQAEDRPFLCFSISPRTGDRLRNAVAAGEVTARAECDGKRYAGRLPAVTALIPGRRKRELWLLAHLYEPLADDNACGVAASIEIARAIQALVHSGELPPLEFSLRLVFAMEVYGFAAFAERMGGALHERAVGAINNDGMPITGRTDMRIHLAPPGTPFFGNCLMESLVKAAQHKATPVVRCVVDEGTYADDACLSDPAVGLPTLWILNSGKALRHNSAQTLDVIDPACLHGVTALTAAWVASVLTLTARALPDAVGRAAAAAGNRLRREAGRMAEASEDRVDDIPARLWRRCRMETARIADFRKVADHPSIDVATDRLAQETRRLIREMAARMGVVGSSGTPADDWNHTLRLVPARASRGFPHDLIAVPKEKRRSLAIMYGPLARVLAGMNGKTNLQELLRQVEWETSCAFAPSQIEEMIDVISYLCDHGYITLRERKTTCTS